MKKLDPELEPYIGPEPTMTMMTTLCLALVVWQIVKWLWNLTSSSSAIQDDTASGTTAGASNGGLKTPTQQYDETILLVGPSLAGKTTLFYATTRIVSAQKEMIDCHCGLV